MRMRSIREYRQTIWCVALVVLILASPLTAQAEEPVHVVQRGENLAVIAARYGSSVQAIASANGLRNPNLIWVGQRLRIPGESSSADNTSREAGVHVVQPGEVLLSLIAIRYGTTPLALAIENNLRNPNLIWAGQRLRIPGGSSGVTPTNSGGTSRPSSGQRGKWIEVILSTQATLAWEGDALVRRMIVSTGVPAHPTVAGRFQVYAKYISTPMAGPGYYLPGVPHTMYYYRGYALHGTYWHNNFGRPMSHGCVNLTRADAAWLYAWTPLGTPVVVHY